MKAERCETFISDSCWDDKIRISDFKVSNIYEKVGKAGVIKFTDKFIIKKIRLKVEDRNKIILNNNNNAKIDVKYDKE